VSTWNRLLPPFEILSCSWPRAVRQAARRWESDPDWNAPVAPWRPQPCWRVVEGEPCWLIDWCDFFKMGVSGIGGEMRGFHVVFRARVLRSGRLVFWDDDGSIVRRGGVVIHEDRSAHVLRRSEIAVDAGDVLEIAHWQLDGEWLWGARDIRPDGPSAEPLALLLPHLASVRERLARPDGPPLKLFTHGGSPLRTVTAIYSMVLNGYAPEAVYLYGDRQWSAASRALFEAALPFARTVRTAEVLSRIASLGQPRLAQMAERHWWIMKTCVGLLEPPSGFCLMDDDVVVLEPVADALEQFRTSDLVYAPDWNHGAAYQASWARPFALRQPLGTGRFNAGLYWCRQVHEPRALARVLASVPAAGRTAFVWEQGCIAAAYAGRATHELPGHRYFYPLFEGLPGGLLGYDYASNPCEFATIHFGGLAAKPGDEMTRYLAPQVLGRMDQRPVSMGIAAGS